MKRVVILLALLVLVLISRDVHSAEAATITWNCGDALTTAAVNGNEIIFDTTCIIDITSEIVITQDTTLLGLGQYDGSGTLIQGGQVTRLFRVESGTLTLRDLSLADGRADAGNGNVGGAILVNNGALDASNVGIGISDALEGGAIFSSRGSIRISNSLFTFNVAGATGGAITIAGGSATITNTQFFGNSLTAGTLGTTIYIANSDFQVNLTCNYWGQSTGPIANQVVAADPSNVVIEPFRTSNDFSASCDGTNPDTAVLGPIIPNNGEVLVPANAPVQLYDSPAGNPIRTVSNVAVMLPHDADGNGFDTYNVNRLFTVGNDTWVEIYIGGPAYGYVLLDSVIISRGPLPSPIPFR